MDFVSLAQHWGLPDLLAQQDRLIRRDQAMAAGLGRAQIDNLVRRGPWVRLLPAVYLVGDGPTVRQRVRAGWLWAGWTATVGGAAAAYWSGSGRGEPEAIDLIIEPDRRLPPQPGYRVLRSLIAESDWRWRDDIRVTTAARTCLDLARAHVDPRAEDGLRRRLLTVDSLEASLSRGAGRRGQRAAKKLVSRLAAGPWSRAESVAHQLLREAGITGWAANLRVVLESYVQFIDIAFADVKLAVEIDGFDTHGDPAVLAADLQRQNRLIAAGWTVLRFTWEDLLRPAEFIARVRRVLARRRTEHR